MKDFINFNNLFTVYVLNSAMNQSLMKNEFRTAVKLQS